MTSQKRGRRILQWHPAFYAGIQIELSEDADNLIFENEHQLGTKPKEIDVLIIKKKADVPVRKNIGRIFRKYNILEYKSPTDYLSVNDFYKVYAYACLFKSDAGQENAVKINEITISFVCGHYPKKLINYLQNEEKYSIIKMERGIYHIKGGEIPIQLILTSELSMEENLWLRSLTDNLTENQITDRLVGEYETHRTNGLYQSVMDIIVRANREKFQEVESMCKALEELMEEMMHDRIEEEVERKVKLEVERKVKLEVERKVKVEVERKVKVEVDKAAKEAAEKATEEGEKKVNCLNKLLAGQNRIEDILKAAADYQYQQKLFQEFAL